MAFVKRLKVTLAAVDQQNGPADSVAFNVAGTEVGTAPVPAGATEVTLDHTFPGPGVYPVTAVATNQFGSATSDPVTFFAVVPGKPTVMVVDVPAQP